MVCVVASCRFSLTIKVANKYFPKNDQKISSCSIISKLHSVNNQPLKLIDLNTLITQVRAESLRPTKIFFEATVRLMTSKFTFNSFKLKLVVQCKILSPLQKLIADIAAPELADFTFYVDDEFFAAHKSILSSRSPVLARMLSNSNYTETQQSFMQINDCAKSTFMMFLRFMYGGSVPYISLDDTIELIKIAEKYQTTQLKRICEDILLDNLTEADPVHNIYQFLNQYNCSNVAIQSAYSLVQK